MRRLYEYLEEPEIKYDGHFHAFNHKSNIESVNGYDRAISFMDLEYDKKHIPVVKSYDRFIQDGYHPYKHILLATGTTIEDIKTIYENHKDKIRGFGELKCYDEYLGEKVPYKKITFVNQVCRFSRSVGCLPVYVHWEITNEKDLNHFKRTLDIYSDIPVVLCHCGMNNENQTYAYTQVCQLMKDHHNLWVDLSYTAARFFSRNVMLLDALDKDKVILGTDANNKMYSKKHDTEAEILDIKSQLSVIENYIGGTQRNNNNITRLFSMFQL